MKNAAGNRAEIGDRDEKGRFIRGNHSNGGRKKQPPEFRECVLDNAPKALDVILTVMNDKSAPASERIRAASIVLERAYGKPDSTVRLETPKAEMLDDIRAEMEALREAERA